MFLNSYYIPNRLYIGITTSRYSALSPCVLLISPIKSLSSTNFLNIFRYMFLSATRAVSPTPAPTIATAALSIFASF